MARIEALEKLRTACDTNKYTDCTNVPHAICDAFGLGHHPYDWEAVLRPVCDAIQQEVDECCVELPVDINGDVIHLGDELTLCADRPRRVVELTLSNNSDGQPYWAIRRNGEADASASRFYRLYRKPTVEDVLREFVFEFARDDSELCDNEIIEAFAKRLRLAEDELYI